jgi:WD40 repeat protein
MDWSPIVPGNLKSICDRDDLIFTGHILGMLATGDCSKNIHIWKPNETEWTVDQRPYTGHTASVEDIQWSPNEQSVRIPCQSVIDLLVVIERYFLIFISRYFLPAVSTEVFVYGTIVPCHRKHAC